MADIANLEKFDASDINPRRFNAEEVLMRQKDDEFEFPKADGTAKLTGRDYDFRESTLMREPTAMSKDFNRELHDEPEESQPTGTTDDAEARADFWSIKVTSSIVTTMNFEFNPTCQRKKHFLFH